MAVRAGTGAAGRRCRSVWRDGMVMRFLAVVGAGTLGVCGLLVLLVLLVPTGPEKPRPVEAASSVPAAADPAPVTAAPLSPVRDVTTGLTVDRAEGAVPHVPAGPSTTAPALAIAPAPAEPEAPSNAAADAVREPQAPSAAEAVDTAVAPADEPLPSFADADPSPVGGPSSGDVTGSLADPVDASPQSDTAVAIPAAGRKWPKGAANCTSYRTYNPDTQTYRGFDGKVRSCRPL